MSEIAQVETNSYELTVNPVNGEQRDGEEVADEHRNDSRSVLGSLVGFEDL